MHEFEVSLWLGMIIFIVSRVKQGFSKCFRGIEDFESFGLRLEIGYGKVKEKMMR